MSILDRKRIVLGVTGGVAAYKAADLASRLVQAGAIVDVVMSSAATNFIGAATFEALTKHPVHLSVFEHWTETDFGHVSLARNADIVILAPATANSIAKYAHGLADDMLGAVLLSTTAPVLAAPAMEHQMFHHPATQSNIATLLARGVTFVGPARGRLASGAVGDGRLAPVDVLVGAARFLLGGSGFLRGTRLVVSAGGTQEALDPVRIIGNRSSGRMGYALAQAGIDAGASVTLVSAPTALEPPYGVNCIRVVSADEMRSAISAACEFADVLIMAAAVADFRPRSAAITKIKKSASSDDLKLDLVRNPDILAGISGHRLVKIGFAAETENLLANAASKLQAKGLDMIVANDAVSTIDSPDSHAHILVRGGDVESLPPMSKVDLAGVILAKLPDLLVRTRHE
ncbi:MAG: bifunctional phosphopantothenoylcysteine decarboxylase/phosphopantothenate--cysteine ligase CoaBC [Thermomicrobiales bacterium]